MVRDRVVLQFLWVLLLSTACQLLITFDAAGQPAQTKPPLAVTHGSEIAAAINIPEKDLKLEGALFLPEKAAHIRRDKCSGAERRTASILSEHGRVAGRPYNRGNLTGA